jgi:hypothetical protein
MSQGYYLHLRYHMVLRHYRIRTHHRHYHLRPPMIPELMDRIQVLIRLVRPL